MFPEPLEVQHGFRFGILKCLSAELKADVLQATMFDFLKTRS